MEDRNMSLKPEDLKLVHSKLKNMLVNGENKLGDEAIDLAIKLDNLVKEQNKHNIALVKLALQQALAVPQTQNEGYHALLKEIERILNQFLSDLSHLNQNIKKSEQLKLQKEKEAQEEERKKRDNTRRSNR